MQSIFNIKFCLITRWLSMYSYLPHNNSFSMIQREKWWLVYDRSYRLHLLFSLIHTILVPSQRTHFSVSMTKSSPDKWFSISVLFDTRSTNSAHGCLCNVGPVERLTVTTRSSCSQYLCSLWTSSRAMRLLFLSQRSRCSWMLRRPMGVNGLGAKLMTDQLRVLTPDQCYYLQNRKSNYWLLTKIKI